MITLTIEQFNVVINQKSAKLKLLLDQQLPIIIGKIATDYFTEKFKTQDWERKPWKDVQRRQATWERNGKTIPNPISGSARTNPILTGFSNKRQKTSGALGRSIDYDESTGKVVIHSDLIYAAVHNFGLRAGRGSGFTMLQRQFIGESPELIALIKSEIEKEINKIFI